MTTEAQRAQGTAFAILFEKRQPEPQPTKQQLSSRRKYERQKARDAEKRIKRTETERVLRDNKHLAAWTI